MPMSACLENVTGVVLAGGRARRMGGVDKGLTPVAGRPMIEHVIARLKPQVSSLIVNANRNLETYGELGYPLVTDGDGEFRGPLAGICAAMEMARTAFIVTVPCDSPLLPECLAERLWRTCRQDGAEIAVAHDGQRLQPVFALIATGIGDDLARYLREGGRKIDRWYESRRLVTVDFSDLAGCFVNVNDPGQRTEIENLLASNAGRAPTT